MFYTVEYVGTGYEIWINEGRTVSCMASFADRRVAHTYARLANALNGVKG